MKQYFTRLAAMIDARNLRERGLLFGLSIVLFAALAHRIFLYAPLVDESRLTQQTQKDAAEISRIQGEIQGMAGQTKLDPDADKKQKLKKLQDEEAAAADMIGNLRRDLVAPEQMVSMLEAIVSRQGPRVHLLALTKLPLQSLNPANPSGAMPAAGTAQLSQPAVAANADTVYKHGVEITVQGNYFDLLNYVAELEKMAGKVIWGKLELQVDAHPQSTMTVQLFTLSLEKKWMNL